MLFGLFLCTVIFAWIGYEAILCVESAVKEKEDS